MSAKSWSCTTELFAENQQIVVSVVLRLRRYSDIIPAEKMLFYEQNDLKQQWLSWKYRSCSSCIIVCQCDNCHKSTLPLHKPKTELWCSFSKGGFVFTLFFDFYKPCCRGAVALLEVVSPAICGLRRCWLLTCSHSSRSWVSNLWYGSRHQADLLLHHLPCTFLLSFPRTCIMLTASSCWLWLPSVYYPARSRQLGFRLGWWGLGDVTHCLRRPFPVWQHSSPSTASTKTPPCPTLRLLTMLFCR